MGTTKVAGDASGAGGGHRQGNAPPGQRRDTAGVIAPPPLIYSSAMALGLAVDALRPAPRLPRGVARPLGLALLGGGLLLGGWFDRTLQRAGTPVSPREPTARLVTDGPYRFSRNPAYLSLSLIYAGLATLMSGLWSILLLPATLLVVRKGVIEREERYLTNRFGAEYAHYAARVRRWL